MSLFHTFLSFVSFHFPSIILFIVAEIFLRDLVTDSNIDCIRFIQVLFYYIEIVENYSEFNWTH